MSNKILIVEDDEDMRRLLEASSIGLGFDVDCSGDGAKGLELALHGPYTLVILDVNLPSMNGFDVCTAIRKTGSMVPILMVSSQGSLDDRVSGLEFGADDYVVKPFSLKEMVARIKALVRRAELRNSEGSALPPEKPTVLHFDELEIDTVKRRVKIKDVIAPLTAIEFDILVFLASAPGRPFTRDELMQAVWGYHSSRFEATITSHLSRVRGKIEPDPATPKFIQTVHGVGYRFMDVSDR